MALNRLMTALFSMSLVKRYMKYGFASVRAGLNQVWALPGVVFNLSQLKRRLKAVKRATESGVLKDLQS